METSENATIPGLQVVHEQLTEGRPESSERRYLDDFEAG